MKKSYRDLKVWQRSVDFAEKIYHLCETFPKHEQYAIANQIRKSAVSIASNIAEGSARYTDKEFSQFLIIARGSLAELHTQLIIACRAKHFSDALLVKLEREIDEIGKMINGLRSSFARHPLTTND